MKKLPLLAFLVLSLIACKKENPRNNQPGTYYTFDAVIGHNDNSTCFSSDGNLLMCGNNQIGLSILKITKSGTLIWQKNFNTAYTSGASSIAELNGEIFICGTTTKNYSSTKSDILLVKANAAGDTIWTKTFGSGEEDYGNNIIRTSDGNILISSNSTGFGAGVFSDIHLIKVDSDGNVIWEASYADPDQESGFHLMETQNGEYLVTGTNENPGGSGRELYLLKVSASGQQLWNKKIGPVWKWGYSTIETAAGDLLICGQHYVPFQPEAEVMLIKTDNLGNIIWEKGYVDSKYSSGEKGNSIKQNPDGTFTICGSVYKGNGQKIFFLKVDQNGDRIWFKTSSDFPGGNALNLLKDGNDNIVTGIRNYKTFMVKTDGDGNYK